MKLLKIAFSNIRKRKSSAITFLSIVMMSALMLSISLSLLLNTNSFYDRKRSELNSGDILIAVPQNYWLNEMNGYIDGYEGVTDYQIINSYVAELKYYSIPSQKSRHQFSVNNSDEIENITINKVTIVDELKVKPANHIYLPLGHKYSGFNSGDKFFLESASQIYEFTIVGFFEDAQFGASTMGIKAAYIDAQNYSKLASDSTFFYSYAIAVQFEQIEISYLFHTDFFEHFKLSSGGVVSIEYETVKMSHTMFALIMSFILIIVAAIVLTIALIIVRFNINNNINEDIKSLGALKSIGFTSKQILLSILLQFLMIATIGSIAGVLIGAVTSGYVGNVVTATSGLLWRSTSFLVPALISILAISAITSLITYLTAKKSKAITPIIALRGGVETHSFKKNHAPLNKSKLPLNISLAIKTFFGGIKSNITAFVVVTLFAFMTVLGFTLHKNFVTDTSAFIQMLGIEPAQVQIGIFDDADVLIVDEIAANEKVIKLVRYDTFSTIVDGKTLDINAWEDITQKERNGIIEGRYPIHDNEISLLASSQKKLNKKVGDVINVEYEGVNKSYLIVGITQGVAGDVCSDMTLQGLMRLKSNAVLTGGYIFLQHHDNDFTDDFIKELKAEYGNKISAVNLKELIDSTLVGLKDPVAIATYLVLGINIATIIFVFFLLVSTIIRRKNKDLGIMKALGFTTKQLILQILLSFLPSVVIGLLLGTALGVALTNPILGIMFSGLGIAKAIFAIPVAVTIIMQFVLLGVCLLTIYFVTQKIKRIAPQKLITEQ